LHPRSIATRGAKCATRWSSTSASAGSERQWSTPLAKTLAEAITVCSRCVYSVSSLTVDLDYRSYICSGIHATMPYPPRRRLLHASDYKRTGPIRYKGRFRYIARDQSGVWGIGGDMAIRGMVGTRKEREGADNRSWAWTRNIDG
jgi:hypothetical protein